MRQFHEMLERRNLWDASRATVGSMQRFLIGTAMPSIGAGPLLCVLAATTTTDAIAAAERRLG